MSYQHDADYKPMASSCGYPTLGCYNPQNAAQARAMVGGNAVQIIPKYTMPGYNTLQHGASKGGCGGHFNYLDAYSHAKGCNQEYVSRVCGGCNVNK